MPQVAGVASRKALGVNLVVVCVCVGVCGVGDICVPAKCGLFGAVCWCRGVCERERVLSVCLRVPVLHNHEPTCMKAVSPVLPSDLHLRTREGIINQGQQGLCSTTY